VEIEHNGGRISLDELPDDIVDAVVDRMAQADPQSDVQLALSCPVCGREWQAAFDIVSFFWTEIDAWARGILQQVHVLASAYGWREADILTMNPGRRQSYLEMVHVSYRAAG
jgi:S-adenosylmethionine synthetase